MMTVYKASEVRQINIDASNTVQLHLERITTYLMNYVKANPTKREVLLQLCNSNGIVTKDDIIWATSQDGSRHLRLLGYNISSQRVMWGGGFGDPDEARPSNPPEWDLYVSW